MSGAGKAFRMATVPVAKQQIDMRYSADDGMWYPSLPTARASGRENSFRTESAERPRKSHPHAKEKDILIIVCDDDANVISSHNEGSAAYHRNPEVQRTMILILDVGSVQDPSGNHAELLSTPYPPTDVNGPLSAERSLPMV